MADRKSSGDKPSEFFRIEATAHLSSELDKEFNLNYPLIQKGNSPLFEDIKKGEIPFFSFNVESTDRAFLNEVVTVALSRAKDPEDYSFSIHGDSGHSTYREAIDTVIKFIKEGSVEIRRNSKIIKVATESGKLEVSLDRFILITSPYERKGIRPFSHNMAIEVNRDSRYQNEISRKKMLRRETLDRGVAFGILLGFYLGGSINNTLDFFADPNFIKSLTNKFGPQVKIPSRTRGMDIKTLAEIASKITVPTSSGSKPSFSPKEYLETLDLLRNRNFLGPKESEKISYSFIPVKDSAQAMVVFKGGVEAAQRIAPPEFLPPERTDYIDRKYGNIVTSEVITAYLLINELPLASKANGR